MGSSRALVLALLAGCATARPTPAAHLPTVATLDGAAVSPEAVAAAHDATVLVWWSTTCPCVRRYQDRMHALRSAYPAARVAIYAVASNADDEPEKVRAAATERGFTLPLLHDHGAALADALAVRTTPTVVVLDRRGAVAYRGWFDNERLPGEPDREPYLERALDAVLAGRSDFQKKSPTYGCPVTRSLGEPSRGCHAPIR